MHTDRHIDGQSDRHTDRMHLAAHFIIQFESLLMTSSAVLPGPENTTDSPAIVGDSSGTVGDFMRKIRIMAIALSPS